MVWGSDLACEPVALCASRVQIPSPAPFLGTSVIIPERGASMGRLEEFTPAQRFAAPRLTDKMVGAVNQTCWLLEQMLASLYVSLLFPIRRSYSVQLCA